MDGTLGDYNLKKNKILIAEPGFTVQDSKEDVHFICIANFEVLSNIIAI